MMANILVVCALTLSSLWLASGYKVLVVTPIPSKSHTLLTNKMVNYLSQAGHEITYVTTIPPKTNYPNTIVIDASDVTNKAPRIEDLVDIKEIINNSNFNNNEILQHFHSTLVKILTALIENENFQNFIRDKNQNFDVVILEWTSNEVLAGFSGLFNCPLIWFSSTDPHFMLLDLIDGPLNPAYNAAVTSSYAPPLTFSQRVGELLNQIVFKLYHTFVIADKARKLYEDVFVPHIRSRGLPVPSLDTLKYNASLILSNSHVSIGDSLRLPPNFITIGGFHVNTVVEPLPKELQELMDTAKDGVIYFSMGTTVNSNNLPSRVKDRLLNVFGKLNQTILWKYEADLRHRPKNVHVLKWAPQQSILAHKNCRIFVSHGGLLSTFETIHFGVPIIGIPVWADHFVNVDKSVKKGYALKVDLTANLANDLEVAIKEMLHEKRYTEKAKELSRIYHDRPIHPGKELVHWVEHVVKTKGALYLRTQAFSMPWYQKMYLDLVALILILILTVRFTLKFILYFPRNKSQNSNSSIKKTN